MESVLSYALPFVLFLFFFGLIRMRQKGRSAVSPVEALSEAVRDPRAWAAIAIVITLFLAVEVLD